MKFDFFIFFLFIFSVTISNFARMNSIRYDNKQLSFFLVEAISFPENRHEYRSFGARVNNCVYYLFTSLQ